MDNSRFSVYINGYQIPCNEGQTILEICLQAKIEIPNFCYHPAITSHSQCHICFVFVEGIEKLLHSCTTVAKEGMRILTHNEMIEEARKEILDLLVSEHPSECPVCVRAGECDFQDLTFLYGKRTFNSRSKNKHPIKQLSPLIQGNMNRCIGCLKCVSFLENITGTGELGVFRDDSEVRVDTCFEEGIVSELSGNLLDLCPSGALIEKPSVFVSRPWETCKVPSIDVMDAMGSSIQLDCKEGKILRILPTINPQINQYWIPDKIRFSYDGLLRQRLDQPYARRNDGRLEPISWIDAFKMLVRKISECQPSEMAFLVGDLVEVDSVYLLRQLLDDMKVYNRDCRVDGSFLPTKNRQDYLFNTTFEGIDLSDACLIIGANIREDAPLLNLRLRSRYQSMPETLGIIGESQDLTFGYTYLGNSPKILNEIAEGSHDFCRVLEHASYPVIILGMDALNGSEGKETYEVARFIANQYKMIRADWNGFNILHRAAGRVGALEVGFVPAGEGKNFNEIIRMSKRSQLKLLYLMGVDEISLNVFQDSFIVYQGHHGDAGAEIADLILPGAAFSEKNGFYVNMEGRAQFVRQAVPPPGQAKEDWKIIRGLSEVLGYKLPYETYDDVYRSVQNYSAVFNQLGSIIPQELSAAGDSKKNILKHDRFSASTQHYYLTNPICRSSPTMLQCAHHKNEFKRLREKR